MKILLTVLLIFQISLANASDPIIANYNYVNKFDSIPEKYIEEARNLRHIFRHASVGTTIDGGLNCLQGTKNNCTEYPQYKYDRRNWDYSARGNSGWYGKIDDFVEQVEQNIDGYDVFGFKYCYLDGLDQVDIPCGRYPSDPDKVKKAWDYLRDNLELLESKYPLKRFIWWTIPLTQVGQHCTDEMNTLIRNHCKNNNKILFDIADIECHDPDGSIVLSSEGTEIAYKPYCGEQKPDAQSCHPNEFGAYRIAKAFWVMMAKIAGWDAVTSIQNSKGLNEMNLISPNPASDYIEIHTICEGSAILIFNSFGERVLTVNQMASSVQRIVVSDLSAGVYFIQFNSQRTKFIKL